jgi:hypothetical protein
MAKTLILADVTTKIGHLNGSYIHDVTLLCPVTLDLHTCVVDEHYGNYTRCGWDRILERPIKYGLYGGLRETKRTNTEGFPVISADSRLELIEALTEEEVMMVIEVRKEELGLD